MSTLTLKNYFQLRQKEIEKERLAEYAELAQTVYKESIPEFIKKDNLPKEDENN